MIRIPIRIIFLAMIIAAAIFSLEVIVSLPGRVAITFNSRGLAVNFMSRNDYYIYILICTIGFPLFIVGVIGWLPKLFPNKINIPNRDYWLEPQNREQTILFLTQHAYRLGCIFTVFMVGIQWLVVLANRQNPPQLDNIKFTVLLIGFPISIFIWIIVILFRFRRKI